MDSLQAIDTFAQGGGYEPVKPDLTHAADGVHIPYSGEPSGGRLGRHKLTAEELARGRSRGGLLGGRRAQISADTAPSKHAARLDRLAERANEKDRAVLLAAAACVRRLSASNKRMAGRWAGHMERGALTERGLFLHGDVERIAEDICELAERWPVHVYRVNQHVRVTTKPALKGVGIKHWIGTYDRLARYDAICDDVRDALKDGA